MGGFFAVASATDCVTDLFYGTDYHSHLGTKRGGLATLNDRGFCRYIHNIQNSQFRSKFEDDIHRMSGSMGIGVISDLEDQPLIIGSHLGVYAIVTVGAIWNLKQLADKAMAKGSHFSEMAGEQINPTELVSTLINEGANFVEGIRLAQESIEGSCSMLLLTRDGIYAARDKFGRTPIAVAGKAGAWAATMETCALPNLGYRLERQLGPGEIVRISPSGIENLVPPLKQMQICTFLWVYYGYPPSSYEGINVEAARYRCGAMLASRDDAAVDCVAGIPDSGSGHAVGYANTKGLPYHRPFVKYTPTWPRSFMPQNQSTRGWWITQEGEENAMAKRNAKKATTKAKKPKSPKQLAVQVAVQVNWELKGCLKNVQLTFLRAAKLLARVRDEKLYLLLLHPTIEEYADEHLRLRKSQLYKYLRVYDWVEAKHPDWLEKAPEGDMPDLNDIADSIQIEKELARTNLDPDKRKALEDMQKRAEKGELGKRELAALRKKTQRTPKQGYESLLKKFYAARRQASCMENLPPDILMDIDGLVGKIKSLMAHDVAGFQRLSELLGTDFGARIS